MNIDELLANNMGLIYKQLHKFGRAYDDDAFSAAFEALYRAALTYDEERSIAFSTYATTCIYNGIACYLRNENNRTKNLPVVSFETIVHTSKDDVFLSDTLSSNDTPETVYLEEERYIMLWKAFDKVLSTLKDKAKRVIVTWKESDFTMPQVELAALTETSQAYVSRTLSAFKHKLRQEMEKY